MGDELRLANIRGDKPRKQGSCVIALEGERAGHWIDFDGITLPGFAALRSSALKKSR